MVYDGTQFLKFWSNGKPKSIKSPILPFCYVRNDPPIQANVEVVQKRLLYDVNNLINLYKCTFRTVQDLRDCCGDCKDFLESRFNFKDRVYTCCPELISKYANTNPLKICCIDFEMSTEGSFPVPETNAIIACGLQFNEKPVELILAATYDDDKDLLEQVFQRIEEEDPDILVTYNGIWFDLPYWIARLKINHMDLTRLSRDKSMPYVTDKLVKLGGRIVYDLYTRSVSRDQNLFKKSPPNRKMKTVAKIYGLDDVVEEPQEIMSNMRAMVGNPELERYLYSDIRCTKFLYDIYFKEIINMAETLGVSLESCVNSSPAYVGHMLFAKEYELQGIVSDKTVGDAYPDLVANKSGALVGSFKPGLYKQSLKKKDIVSDYPNLVRTFNLSPETCFLIRTEKSLQPYMATMDSVTKVLTLSIPDEKLRLQLIIGIDFNIRGFASTFVDKAMTDRLLMKQQMKSLDHNSPEYADLDVSQLGLKVIMNSITGYYGQAYSMYGSLACYCAITGTGRFLITKLIEFLGGVVALDTDGVVTEDNISLEETNAWLEKFVLDFFGVPKNYMMLEQDDIYAAYFRAEAKQYLIIEEDSKGKLHYMIHGASFKGSNLLKLFTTIIEDIGYKMLLLDPNDAEAVKQFDLDIAKYYDKSTWTLDLLKKSNKCKPVAEYKGPNAIGANLVRQYESRFKTTVKVETQLEYVKVRRKTRNTYMLVTIFDTIDDIIDLDYKYYEEVIDSAFERLGLLDHIPRKLNAPKQKSLFDF